MARDLLSLHHSQNCDKFMCILCKLLKLCFVPVSRQSKPALRLAFMPLPNFFGNSRKAISVQTLDKQGDRVRKQIQTTSPAYIRNNKSGIDSLLAGRQTELFYRSAANLFKYAAYQRHLWIFGCQSSSKLDQRTA